MKAIAGNFHSEKKLPGSFYVFLMILELSAAAFSGQSLNQTIKGHVSDADSRENLAGANIIILDSNPRTGASSDSDGFFKISNVPPGRYNIQVIYMGYQDLFVNEVLISSGKEVVLNIEMRENIIESDAIIVKANIEKEKPLNTMAVVSVKPFTVEETQRYAASINDPARLVQSFAGVSTADDENNELVIRGNSPRGMLWRLEGIEIPNPNHFADGEGASGGGVSMLSSNMLTQSDFFTGAFPADYGNALSGVFDIRLRNGNSEKREYAIQTGVMGADVSAEGPFSSKSNATYLFNYRYSTLTFLNDLGITIGDDVIIPRFQDFSFKINLPTDNLGVFSIFGLGGLSDAGNYMPKDSLEWLSGKDRYGETEEHKMGVIGLSHFILFEDNATYMENKLSISAEEHIVLSDSLDNNYKRFNYEQRAFSTNSIRISTLLNHKINAAHIFQGGVIYSSLGYSALQHISLKNGHFNQTFIDEKGTSGLLQTFAQWKFRPSNALTVNSGLHYMYFLLNNHYTLEPRFAIKWAFTEDQALSMAAGIHSKLETVSNYLSSQQQADGRLITPNRNMDLTKSFQAVLGYNNRLTSNLHLKIETYYQYLYDVPVGSGENVHISALNFRHGFATIPLKNAGTGTNYGVEFTLERFLSDNYYFLASASLFESKFKTENAKEFNSAFNGNYVFNFLMGKEFFLGSNNNVLGLNSRFICKGGNRYTPVDKEASSNSRQPVYKQDQLYSKRLDDYIRLDMGISFRRNNPGYSWIVSMDIQNVTNRKNIAGQYYSISSGKMNKEFMLGLVPVINYKVEF